MESACKEETMECDALLCKDIVMTAKVEESRDEILDQKESAAFEYVSLPKVEVADANKSPSDGGRFSATNPDGDVKREPTHTCVPCGLGFGDEDLLVDHLEHCPHRAGDSDEDVYDCVFCDERIPGEASYRRHVGTCSKRKWPDGKYRCDRCPYATNIKRRFWRHGSNHAGENGLFECPSCDMTFGCRRGLSGHLRVHRKEDADGEFACAECGKRYRYRHNLMLHVAVKHLERTRYRCDDCDFETDWRSNLKTHRQLKHGAVEKRHACADCDYAAHTRSNLTRHAERWHGKGKRREPQKDKRYQTKGYRCDECGFRTSRRFNLNAHVEVKHRTVEKRHACADCDYAAHNKSNLIKHMKRKHGKGKS